MIAIKDENTVIYTEKVLRKNRFFLKTRIGGQTFYVFKIVDQITETKKQKKKKEKNLLLINMLIDWMQLQSRRLWIIVKRFEQFNYPRCSMYAYMKICAHLQQ